MKIAVFLFDGVTVLDAVGVSDLLARLPATEIVFMTETGAPCVSGDGSLTLTPRTAITDVHDVAILVVPGGAEAGLRTCIGSETVRTHLTRIDKTTVVTASVCTGALILGAAGLLRGRKAATNWRAKDYLARFGAEYTGERVTKSDKYWTAAGVTAGIDHGLALCEKIAGPEIAAAVELAMEYDPKPPFGGGNPHAASRERRRLVEDALRG